MNRQKEQKNDKKESPVRHEKPALSAALAGLVLFTGLAGPVEAAVVNVEEKIQSLRGAESAGSQGTILGGVEKRASTSATVDYTESYTQSYTQTYTQTYNQGPRPIEPIDTIAQ